MINEKIGYVVIIPGYAFNHCVSCGNDELLLIDDEGGSFIVCETCGFQLQYMMMVQNLGEKEVQS